VILVRGHHDHPELFDIADCRTERRCLTNLTMNCGKILDYYTATSELEILPSALLVNLLIGKLNINYKLKASYISDYHKT